MVGRYERIKVIATDEIRQNFSSPKLLLKLILEIHHEVNYYNASYKQAFSRLALNTSVLYSCVVSRRPDGYCTWLRIKESGFESLLGTLCCVLGQDIPPPPITPTMTLSTQVYKWVPVNLMWGGEGVTLLWEILPVASCYSNSDLMSRLACMQALPFPTKYFSNL